MKAALVVMALVPLCCACDATTDDLDPTENLQPGEVLIEVTRTLPANHDLTSLTVPLARVAVQPEGEHRDLGLWRNLETVTNELDLIQDTQTRVGLGQPLQDRYHRIFVEVADLDLEATTLSGETRQVLNHVEPIAIPFLIDDDHAWKITLDLILIEDLRTDTQTYTLYCRDANIQQVR